MELRINPQRSDNTVGYRVDSGVLVATVNGVDRRYVMTPDDNGSIDIPFPDPDNDGKLPLQVVLSARVTNGETIVDVIGFYGPEPERIPEEADDEFANRYAKWQNATQERTVVY